MKKIGVGTFRATPRMYELVTRVLDTGRISYGPMSRMFEQRFAEIHNCQYAVLSNSGTSSLQVALQALKELHGWKDGDEVIVPACTFVATVNVVLHNRMRPVLADIEPDYYGIEREGIEAAITDRTKAIIPVHLFGQPCEMLWASEVDWRTAHRGVKVIEDSCECMFVSHRAEMVGSMGDVGCFSTYVAHLLSTGVGGIATTNNPHYAAKMRSLVNHGRDGIYISIDDDDGLNPTRLGEVISRRFNFEAIGHSFRITELEAALALAQLDGWEEMITRRQDNAAYLTVGLGDLEGWGLLQLPKVRPFTEHAFMMYPIVAVGQDKWPLCNFLEQRGIETREMLRLTDQPVYLEMGLWDPDDYPVAKAINESGFYVGCHQDLEREDLDWIISALHDYYGGQHEGWKSLN